MNRLLIFPLLLLAITAQCQSPNDNITIGKRLTINSGILHEKRQVLVYLPGSYYDTYFYRRRYPVVYALDGDSHFYNVAGMIKQMSEDGGGIQFPEMILVAIQNADRNRDLTPTRDTSAESRMGNGTSNHSGGGEPFLSFIAGELIPHIDSIYPTAPYRIFIGHSLGGLTVINALVHHKDLFNAYLTIDPSMMWDHSRLLHQAEDLLPTTSYKGRSLFMATANSLQDGLDTVSVKSDSSNPFSRHMRSMFLLRDALAKSAPTTGLSFHWKYYPEYDHQTVPLPAEYDGLRFLFDFYHSDFPYDSFFDPAYKGDSTLALHYAQISRQMGYTVTPPEPFINNLGYGLLGRHQFDRAFYFFDLNIRNYPNSFNVYDSMGDLLLARGEKTKAAENFKKSLSLRENPDTRKKLEKLQHPEIIPK